MSRDQRPARVKLVDSSTPAVPVRRADDVVPAAGEASVAPKTSSSGVLYAMIFLIGSMIGAAGISLLPKLGLQ